MSHPNATRDGARWSRLSLIPAIVFIFLALLGLTQARQQSSLASALYDFCAALFVTGAGFLAAALADWTRSRGISGTPNRRARRDAHRPSRDAQRSLRVRERLRELTTSAGVSIKSLDPTSEPIAILATVTLSVIALITLSKGWRIAQPVEVPATLQAWTAGTAIVLVFPFLVLERHLTSVPQQRLPEAAMLARLCRLPMLSLLGLGLSRVAGWLGFPGTATLIEHGVAVVIGLVALELSLRSIFRWYASPVPASERHSHADSAIAGILRLQWPNVALLGETVTRQFGIDLGRSWALSFVRRALLPALLALAVFSWLLTGVSALDLGERAVYESFGKPVAVLQPGLHVHLPWPFGIFRPVEFGRVREIPIVFATEDGSPGEMETQVQPTPADIEGPPPATTDRLWDASHPSEASYLVASLANGRQNFEVINIDLRVMYRIGLSDAAAREAIYDIASPEDVIRAAAGQMLARYFARYTVLDVLGQNREAFIRGFQRELQDRLTGLTTGIEVMGIVVEAIHPPPAAAPAYQGVQTAAIQSVVRIAEAKEEATQALNSAQSDAFIVRNDAAAAAAERLGSAKTELTLFAGDRQAYNTGGPSFLFERRLQHVDRALMGARLTIIDHRIDRTNAPLLDLRPPSSASDTFTSPPGRETNP